jgi:anti-sigma B factor antagonist
MNLNVSTKAADGVAVIRIDGRLDALTSPELQSAAGAAITGGNAWVIYDMRDVGYVSSAGLRTILLTTKQAKAAHGGVAVFGLQPAVKEVFDISGYGTIVPIAADETEARAKLGA